MAIYVDEVKFYEKTGSKYHEFSHLVSNKSLEELHEFALKLGLRKSYFQKNHYDITPSKRSLAIKLGAIPTNTRNLIKIMVGN